MQFEFNEVARLPAPGDNVAIATRTLEPGTTITHGETTYTLTSTLLEGHRFAVRPIQPGETLTSWQQAFSTAIKAIAPGDYVCNAGVLEELGRRSMQITLPAEPNFMNELPAFAFDEAAFSPAPALPLYTEKRTFMGYPRGKGRGVGTRNFIVLLGTTSLTGSFVRALEERLKTVSDDYANIDGIVAVAHTEGGHENPNNRELLLRTLAGFMVHPNVGAVLAVDYGHEAVNNHMLLNYLRQHDYPLEDVPHHFMSLSGSLRDHLDTAQEIVTGWLDRVNATQREAAPLSALKIALQCGGSDAFSGVSGNPLAAWVAREVLRYGGAANLAETDELIGAESYTVQKVRDVETARKFLATVKRFQEWAGWHGASAEGNPSGGNKYRGLYNIYLKSLGAAAKRHPDVRLDYVIDYAETMREPGFYFMDSPGNDLESIAGQVASGCNLIFFVTGNGSITNFPFVPTIKIVTTSERYRLLPHEMDVNAGAYLDGTPMDELGQQTLDLTVETASGQLTVGEKAHHAQVQIWRNWHQTGTVAIDAIKATYSGEPLRINVDVSAPDNRFEMLRTPDGHASEQVGLILPTSLCSGQIARICANYLNERKVGQQQGLSRIVTLVHTEGCGSSTVTELTDTLLGYLQHPTVRFAMLLEHGCEKTHNDYIRHLMLSQGLEPQNYGWASVQLDGGIQAVTQKIARWFQGQLDTAEAAQTEIVGAEAMRVGLITQGDVSEQVAHELAALTQGIVAAGGLVIVPAKDKLLASSEYRESLLGGDTFKSTLAYGQHAKTNGFHVMETYSTQWTEALTGLGAAGAEIIMAHVDTLPMPGHPLVPVIQITSNLDTAERYAADIDGLLEDTHGQAQMLNLLAAVLSRQYEPKSSSSGFVDFQITRGLFNVSL